MAKNQNRSASSQARTGRERYAEDVTPKDRNLGKDTSHGGKPFQYGEAGKLINEPKAKLTTMEDSGGNSLQSENPTYAKQSIPTKHPENLQLGDSYNAWRFEGGGEGDDKDYVLATDEFEAPSEDADSDFGFEVPSQIPEMAKRNPRIHAASKKQAGFGDDMMISDDPDSEGGHKHEDDEFGDGDGDSDNVYTAFNGKQMKRAQFEDHIYRTLLKAGANKRKLEAMSFDDGRKAYSELVRRAGLQTSNSRSAAQDLRAVAAEREQRIQAQAAKIRATASKDVEDVDDEETFEILLDKARKEAAVEFERRAELYAKRVKAAYAACTRMALANCMPLEKIDSTVESWLADNLSVAAIQRNMQFVLASTQQARREANASARQSQQQVRTASVTSNPAFMNTDNSAPRELHSALSSTFSIGGLDRALFNKFDRQRRIEQEGY